MYIFNVNKSSLISSFILYEYICSKSDFFITLPFVFQIQTYFGEEKDSLNKPIAYFLIL